MEIREMRTDAEILARIETVKERGLDWLGTQRWDLVLRLPYELAKPYLKEGVGEEDWKPSPRDEEAVRAEMHDYMDFAWDKANNRRGISAGRSLAHMAAWLWLVGLNEAADAMDHYDYYGKPHLRAICEHFDWNWRKWDDERWTTDELVDGLAPPESVDPLPGTAE